MRMFFCAKVRVWNKSVNYLLVFLLLLTFVNVATQKALAQNIYDVKGTVKNNGKKLDGAVVTLYKGSSQIQQITTTSNGRFDVKMELNGEYTLTMTKSGFITKKFYFNTKGVPDDRAKEEFGGQDIEVSLFQLPKDPNVVSQISTILNQPMAKFYYDDGIKEIEYDKAYSQSMIDALAKLSQIEKEANKKAEEEAKKNADLESAAASQYQAAVSKADAAFAKKDYATAKTAYQDALTVKGKEPYPHDQIVLIEKLIADGAKNAQLDADYKAAIAKADAAFGAKTYDAAKTSYNDALKLKPAEAYPKTKLSEIEKLLTDAAKGAELEAKYKAAIQKGDAALSGKTYESAKAAYNEALGIKPAEKYPKDKLAEIDKILADIAAKEKADKDIDEKYKAAIANGDKSFGSKLYSFAKPSYEEALKLKPSEAYPKTKLAEIEKLLAEADAKANSEKELAAKYTAAIAKGDAALKTKDYANAKSAYTDATGLKPSEQYPKDKLAEIEKALADAAAKDAAEKDKLAKAAELEAKYKAAIAKGDAALGKKDYTAAKAGYTEALGLKSAEQYPKDKLVEIDKAIADAAAAASAEKDKAAKEKELNDKYNAAIAKADKALASKTYDAAKTGYNEALGLKPAEKYPKDKLAEIEKALADAAAKDASEKDKLAKEKELNDKYNAAIAKGDGALKSKSYDDAKAGYNEALGLKPSEKYPKDKLAEIEKVLADAAAKDAADKDKLAKATELEAKYKAAISKADAALGTKDYAGAKTSYNEALTLKATEKYPKDKIAEIDAILAKEMGAKELEKKYADAIAKADAALGTKDYAGAKTQYNAALGFKPAEKYPKDKLAEIEKALADAAAEKDKLAKAAELDAKYKAAIAKGDKALVGKTYDAAKSAYNEALGFKSAEQYPKDKIAEIDAILAKEMGAKELDAKYTAAIAKADGALKSKSYDDAKAGYNEALGLKPAEKYPKDKLAEIEKALADAAAKDAADKDKLAKAAELEAKYKAAIAKADAALGTKDYAGAKTSYNEALTLKATEKYPKDKIAEIDAILAKEMGAKELEKKYADAIAKADAALGTKDYAGAKTQYNAALGFKPAEKYPKDKLAEIEKALADLAAASKGAELEAKYKAAIAKADAALSKKDYSGAKSGYNEALGIKSAEQYPKDKLAEIEKALADSDAANKNKALDAKYQAAIAKADAAFGKKDYSGAKSGYNEALGIKSAEQYPKDKLAEIEKALADSDAANKNKASDAKYQAAIAKADAALGKKDYSGAKSGYNAALGIKSEEQYPKDKIAEIEKILADIANKDASAKELETKYASDLTKGDAAFASKDYEAAKSAYTDATGLKPAEKYPKDKLAEVEKALAAITEANKGKDLETNYKTLIAKADVELNSQDYTSAKADYIEASGLKPSEQYPKDQVMKLAGLIAAQAKNKVIQAKYDAAIAKADAAFGAKDYTGAIAGYKEASGIKSTEPYPVNKITEINGILDDMAHSKDRDKTYSDAITKGDRLFSAKDYKAAKNSYLDAQLVKPTEQYPKDKIAECDVFLKKKGGTTTIVTTTPNDDFKSDLAKKYPEGITEESGTEPNAKVTRRIVVKGHEGHMYVRKETSFGPIYYFKDGVPIKEEEFTRDTEVQE